MKKYWVLCVGLFGKHIVYNETHKYKHSCSPEGCFLAVRLCSLRGREGGGGGQVCISCQSGPTPWRLSLQYRWWGEHIRFDGSSLKRKLIGVFFKTTVRMCSYMSGRTKHPIPLLQRRAHSPHSMSPSVESSKRINIQPSFSQTKPKFSSSCSDSRRGLIMTELEMI